MQSTSSRTRYLPLTIAMPKVEAQSQCQSSSLIWFMISNSCALEFQTETTDTHKVTIVFLYDLILLLQDYMKTYEYWVRERADGHVKVVSAWAPITNRSIWNQLLLWMSWELSSQNLIGTVYVVNLKYSQVKIVDSKLSAVNNSLREGFETELCARNHLRSAQSDHWSSTLRAIIIAIRASCVTLVSEPTSRWSCDFGNGNAISRCHTKPISGLCQDQSHQELNIKTSALVTQSVVFQDAYVAVLLTVQYL